MTETKLKNTLLSIVRRYGFERVERSLHEIRSLDHQLKSSKSGNASPNGTAEKKKKKSKVTASEYVAKMELSAERTSAVVELAKKFEDKSFLPAFGDIREFCQIYGIPEPASKSRASAISRVFKFIATMETDELKKILNNGMFSGPSRLGPIADAILHNSTRREAQKPMKKQYCIEDVSR